MTPKILIIEDNTMVLKSLEFKLIREGFEVLTASDGRQGMSLIREGSFELVITDLMLPFITGLEIIEYIKTEHPDTAVIVLSTSNQEHIIADAFNLGADDFITKPFNPNELTLRVKRSLGIRKT
ncbi:response regulator transcription factor [Robertkochia aurantiaca]|uniref:response regulator transcription factor n=1 Tax=Robertkochia aurantiaca TaxID=2873700 RepID=UPI001CCD0D57|nr:response regulator [Robertkochia sp. 3YJGBD-33]